MNGNNSGFDPKLLRLRLLGNPRIKKSVFVSTGSPTDKERILPSITKLLHFGVEIFATAGTSAYLRQHGVPNQRVSKISEQGSADAEMLLIGGRLDLVVNILTGDKAYDEDSDAQIIRERATVNHIPVYTNPDVAIIALEQLVRDLEEDQKNEAAGLWDFDVDFAGRVARLGGYANNHAHADKSYLMRAEVAQMGQEPMQKKTDELFPRIKRGYTFDNVFPRIEHCVQRQIAQGTTYFRTMVDADPTVGLIPIKAALAVREKYQDHIRIDIGIQPLEGVLHPKARAAFEEACGMADFVGGLPSKNRPNEADHIRVVLQIAREQGKRLDVHVDQKNDPDERETELLARMAIKYGMEGRVSAIHSISLSAQEDEYRSHTISLLKNAGVSVILCPFAALSMAQPQKIARSRNSIGPFVELSEAGVKTYLGSDNISDLYMPVATGSMRDEAHALMEACRVYDIEAIAKMACDNSLMSPRHKTSAN